MLTVDPAERLQPLSIARSPCNPQYRRPCVGSLALPGHLVLPSPIPLDVQTLEGRPRSPPQEAPSWLLPPGPPSTAGRQQTTSKCIANAPYYRERQTNQWVR